MVACLLAKQEKKKGKRKRRNDSFWLWALWRLLCSFAPQVDGYIFDLPVQSRSNHSTFVMSDSWYFCLRTEWNQSTSSLDLPILFYTNLFFSSCSCLHQSKTIAAISWSLFKQSLLSTKRYYSDLLLSSPASSQQLEAMKPRLVCAGPIRTSVEVKKNRASGGGNLEPVR